MKAFLCSLTIALAIVAVHCDLDPEVGPALKACQTELGVPAGPPNLDDPKGKCVHACVSKKIGHMVDGKIVAEKEIEHAKKHIPNADSTLTDKISECVKTANAQTDECEVSAAFHKCVVDKIGQSEHHH